MVKSLPGPSPRNRRLPHSDLFFLSARILDPPTPDLRMTINENFNDNNKMMDRLLSDMDKPAHYFPFLSQPDLPGLPTATRSCLRCGEAVPAPKRTGRPSRFCSEECRTARLRDQQTEAGRTWTGKATESACRTCGEAIRLEGREAGRLPGFCGAECRAAGKRARAAGYRARQRRLPGGASNLQDPPT